MTAQVLDAGDARGEAFVERPVRAREGQHVRLRVDRVHVRPVRHRRPVRGTVEHGDDPVPADAGGHLEPGRTQLLRDKPGRLPLLARELGAAVDLPAQLDQFLLKIRHRQIVRTVSGSVRAIIPPRISVDSSPDPGQDRDHG